MSKFDQQSLQLLRLEAEQTRSEIAREMARLEGSFDIAGRMKREISAHPLKWTAIAAAGGIAAAKILPLLPWFRGGRMAGRVLGFLTSTVGAPIAGAYMRRAMERFTPPSPPR